MKAVVIHQYGDSTVLQLEEVAPPKITPDRVLIKVRATTVNPIDWKIRSGKFRLMPGNKLPLILGFDVCGEVLEVGSAVTRFQVGDRVYGTVGLPGESVVSRCRKVKFVMQTPSAEDLVYLKELVEADKIRPIVDRVYPLTEITAAHKYSESGHAAGKIVMAIA